MTLRTLPQPEHRPHSKDSARTMQSSSLPFQPDQTPLAGMSDSVAQGEQLG